VTYGDYFSIAEDLRRRSGSLAIGITGDPAGIPSDAAQAVLSEYLASHGYVVAAARPKAVEEKLPFELQTAGGKLEELDAQTDDLRGALRARDVVSLGTRRDGAVAAGLRCAARRGEVVVCLDGPPRESGVLRGPAGVGRAAGVSGSRGSVNSDRAQVMILS
jgi:hypothetical protein